MNLRTVAVVPLVLAAVMAPTAASAQPEAVPADVPIAVVLYDVEQGPCTFSMVPKSNVTMGTLATAAAELGQIKVWGVSNCGTVSARATVTDTGAARPSFTTANVCATATAAGCTAKATQNVPYALGAVGQVTVHTRVSARGVTLCFDDRWAVVGGVSATYVAGGPAPC